MLGVAEIEPPQGLLHHDVLGSFPRRLLRRESQMDLRSLAPEVEIAGLRRLLGLRKGTAAGALER